jgi:hypothetical protein
MFGRLGHMQVWSVCIGHTRFSLEMRLKDHKWQFHLRQPGCLAVAEHRFRKEHLSTCKALGCSHRSLIHVLVNQGVIRSCFVPAAGTGRMVCLEQVMETCHFLPQGMEETGLGIQAISRMNRSELSLSPVALSSLHLLPAHCLLMSCDQFSQQLVPLDFCEGGVYKHLWNMLTSYK